jgi:putative peptidoglycan lipid II flippase
MKQRLLRSTSIVSSMTMISRLLGFARDVILATIFGAGAEFDAFVIAFKIPNFMRRLFAEGAFSQAFVPVLSEYRAKQNHQQVREFVNNIAGTLGAALLLVVIIAELGAPWIIKAFAPGFIHDPMRLQYATYMLHITFPYLLFIGLTAFAGATLNTFNRFAVPAFTPVFMNIVLISVAWWWAPHTSTPIYMLAWGVFISGIIQLLFQVPFLKQIDIFPKPALGWRDPGVRRVLKLMIPALFGVSVAQISLLIDNLFASFLPAGSISWLYYSDRLTYLPLGVIGVALATVVLPNLARHHSSGSHEAFSKTLDWSIRCALLLGVPCAVGLFILAGPILATLIQHGAFGAHDVLMTQRSLWAFSAGLPGFMLIKILASAFYSRQNIKTPVKVAATAMAINLGLNFILIHPLAHAGLALSTSIASAVNAFLLLFFLLRKKIFTLQSGWLPIITRIVCANVLMAATVFWLAGDLTQWLHWGVWPRIWHLTYIIACGGTVYVAALLVLGMRKHDLRPPVA